MVSSWLQDIFVVGKKKFYMKLSMEILKLLNTFCSLFIVCTVIGLGHLFFVIFFL